VYRVGMHWWTGQNLDRPIVGPDGTTWHFLVCHGPVDGVHTQRIFFWDEAKRVTGLVELRGTAALHIKRIKDRMRKIARDERYRERFLRPLQFPLQRYEA
jgi:hypothetical protein